MVLGFCCDGSGMVLFCFLDIYVCALCACLVFSGVRRGMELQVVCEPWYGCWGLNSGRLEEQSVLLTAVPSLQFLVPIPSSHQ